MAEKQTATEPTPTQTTEPTIEPDVAAPVENEAVTTDEGNTQQGTEPESMTAAETPPQDGDESEARVVPKPNEYELPEGAPDNLRTFANEHGFTQEQLNATLQQFGGYLHGMQQTEQQALLKKGEAHVEKWGADAKTRLSLARAALRQNDPEGKLFEALTTSGWGNHPDVLDFLYSIGKSMQEGGFLKSAVPRSPGEKTAAQAMYGANHPSKQ